ncbi:MAG: type IV toxin-antitoxin system AbiEi family antitoxin domain-containing protein [Acidimicrobiales bacterium]
MAHVRTIETLANLAEDQWGLVTRQQSESAGLAWTTLSRLASGDAVLERVARGVYRLRGSPPPDHLELRAAWMQLAPATMVWERTPEQGVVSHRSAAAVYGLGDLTADRHECTLPARRQSRRSDVRLHITRLEDREWLNLGGLLVTRPARIAADLLADGEEPDAVAPIVVEALRRVQDYPGSVAAAIAPLAARFGLRRNDGLALLRWLLELSPDADAPEWLREAVADTQREAYREDGHQALGESR